MSKRLAEHTEHVKKAYGFLSTFGAASSAYACLPVAQDSASLFAWAQNGGISTATEAWANADRLSATLRIRPRCATFFQPVIDAQLFAMKPSKSVIYEAIAQLLDDVNMLIDDARGPEPVERYTAQYELWEGYRPPREDDRELHPAIIERFETERREGRAETAVWSTWSKIGQILSRTWRLALLTIAQLIMDPEGARTKAELVRKRRQELCSALARYPLRDDVEGYFHYCDGYEELISEPDDAEAVKKRPAAISSILAAMFRLPQAAWLLEKCLMYKNGRNPAPLELYSHRNPKTRAMVHNLVRDVGGLLSTSRDDAGDGMEAQTARKRIEMGQHGVWLQKTIVVTRMSDQSQLPTYNEATKTNRSPERRWAAPAPVSRHDAPHDRWSTWRPTDSSGGARTTVLY